MSGAHKLTALFIGYYGQSNIPGLVPIDVPNLHDTIDPRQRDQTHTGEIAPQRRLASHAAERLALSGFFRAYNLSLFSNFGDGLIRQSEFRTVTGGNANYIRKFNRHFSLMAGLDYFREAPRRDDLDHYLSADPFVYGPFERVTANNITLNFVTPFVAIDGNILPWLRYNLGWRRDQIGFDNTDLLTPRIRSTAGRASIRRKPRCPSCLPKACRCRRSPSALDRASLRTTRGSARGHRRGSLISQAHAYQLVVSKTFRNTDFRVTLGHVTQEASLAKIDPDTGLQFDEGPSRNRYMTVSGPSLLSRRTSRSVGIESRRARSFQRRAGAGSSAADCGRTGDS